MKISIGSKIIDGPFGGGNEFLKNFINYLENSGHTVINHLNDKGIPCGVYYPIPLHLQKAYVSENYKDDDFKVTLEIVNQVISLPMHTELTDNQIDFITDTVKSFMA